MLFHPVKHCFLVGMERLSGHKLPRGLPDTGVSCHQLGHTLIHTGGGSRHIRADAGDARQLQKPLHSAVLAVFAVKHGEHHVDALTHHAVALKAQQSLPPDGRNGRLPVGLAGLPLACGQLAVIVGAVKHPVAGFGNAHRVDVVLFGIHMVQDGLCRTQRDLMFRRDTAK